MAEGIGLLQPIPCSYHPTCDLKAAIVKIAEFAERPGGQPTAVTIGRNALRAWPNCVQAFTRTPWCSHCL